MVCEPDREATGRGYGEWRDAIRRDPCCYCGRPVTPYLLEDGGLSKEKDRGTVEHVQRKVDGGRGLRENTVGACARCNHTRRDLTVLDMLLRERDGVTIAGLPMKVDWRPW